MYEHQRSEKVYPKHLNWKCLDNFEKVPDEKMFYIGEVKLSHVQRQSLNKLFKEIREKYQQKVEAFIKNLQKQEKTHLEISGGGYSFFFILPRMFKYIKQNHPYLKVSLSLFEISDEAIASKLISDIALRGNLLGNDEKNALIMKSVKAQGYFADRKFIEDAMFFAASKKLIEEFDGVDQALNLADILYARDYIDSSNQAKIDYLYSPFPEKAKNTNPKVIVDQYYMKYLLMQRSVGIGHVHKSMYKHIDISILDEQPFAIYKRFCLVKKHLNKRYFNITKSFMQVMESKVK